MFNFKSLTPAQLWWLLGLYRGQLSLGDDRRRAASKNSVRPPPLHSLPLRVPLLE